MTIVDANVLIYSIDADAARHETARRWLVRTLEGPDTVGFAWMVLLAFIRLVTSARLFPKPLTVPQATDIVATWLSAPNTVVVQPGSRHGALLASLLDDVGTAGNLVNDAHLAALAIENNAVIGSFDADFARFTGVRWEQPS